MELNQLSFTNPKAPTLAVTYDATVSGSTEITLNVLTTYIEITAIAKGMLLPWGAGDASTSAFDEYISPNTTRLYPIPSGTTAVNFIQASANGILVVIEK